MAYVSQSNLVDRFSEQMLVSLTDRAIPQTGQIDADVVSEALGVTDAIINGYLAARYVLPMAAVPPQIVDIAYQIAIYKLHIYATDPKIEADYKMALKTLQDIRDGKIRLPIEGVTPQQTGETGVRTTDRERPMTAINLRGFI